jgi:hypothetical protein
VAGLLKPKKPPRGLQTKGGRSITKKSLEKLPKHPRGREELKLGLKSVSYLTGPGEPPDGFVDIWTSITEWYVYWALFKLTSPGMDARRPPFLGNDHFVYQKAEQGGRVPGGSVTDFAITTPTGYIGLRVETERWHIWTTAEKQMNDLQIKTHLDSMERVISIWDQHFIGDETGQQVIHVVSLALKGIELPSPIKWGNAQRIR